MQESGGLFLEINLYYGRVNAFWKTGGFSPSGFDVRARLRKQGLRNIVAAFGDFKSFGDGQ